LSARGRTLITLKSVIGLIAFPTATATRQMPALGGAAVPPAPGASSCR
jgi:hypothetical protein